MILYIIGIIVKINFVLFNFNRFTFKIFFIHHLFNLICKEYIVLFDVFIPYVKIRNKFIVKHYLTYWLNGIN